MASTPCPHCGKSIRVTASEKAACQHCGGGVRFVDVPERPCSACAVSIPFPPGKPVVRCPACSYPNDAGGRKVQAYVRCPTCSRRIQVAHNGRKGDCKDCGAHFTLADMV